MSSGLDPLTSITHERPILHPFTRMLIFAAAAVLLISLAGVIAFVNIRSGELKGSVTETETIKALPLPDAKDLFAQAFFNLANLEEFSYRMDLASIPEGSVSLHAEGDGSFVASSPHMSALFDGMVSFSSAKVPFNGRIFSDMKVSFDGAVALQENNPSAKLNVSGAFALDDVLQEVSLAYAMNDVEAELLCNANQGSETEIWCRTFQDRLSEYRSGDSAERRERFLRLLRGTPHEWKRAFSHPEFIRFVLAHSAREPMYVIGEEKGMIHMHGPLQTEQWHGDLDLFIRRDTLMLAEMKFSGASPAGNIIFSFLITDKKPISLRTLPALPDLPPLPALIPETQKVADQPAEKLPSAEEMLLETQSELEYSAQKLPFAAIPTYLRFSEILVSQSEIISNRSALAFLKEIGAVRATVQPEEEISKAEALIAVFEFAYKRSLQGKMFGIDFERLRKDIRACEAHACSSFTPYLTHAIERGILTEEDRATITSPLDEQFLERLLEVKPF